MKTRAFTLIEIPVLLAILAGIIAGFHHHPKPQPHKPAHAIIQRG